MSNPHLPPELLDHIVDLLHDAKHALMDCCLVSKSWIPRTRKHLFADIRFYLGKDLQSWKKTFPDPSTSPACYAETLRVGCCHIIAAADAEPGGWITSFSRVVNLELTNCKALPLRTRPYELVNSFVPFHRISPIIKSLRVDYISLLSSQTFNLIISFPLLQDLAVVIYAEMVTHEGDGSDEPSTPVQPSSSPAFTGSLELSLMGGMKPIACRLLSLPGGLHFRKLILDWRHKEDPSLTAALVEECSHTLESLDIAHLFYSESGQASVNLSKATRLKCVVFRFQSQSADWITTTLQTITSEHRDLQQISIYVPHYSILRDVSTYVRENVVHWLDLDHLLVQFWESRSIRPKVVCPIPKEGKQSACMGDSIGCLLPEIVGRGIINLVEC